jgi:hypothetical protein
MEETVVCRAKTWMVLTGPTRTVRVRAPRGTPLLTGEGFPALSLPPSAMKTYPRSLNLAYAPGTSSPRGSHPEVCRWRGWGRRLRVGVTPRSREASGHRPGDTTVPVRGARWKAGRETSRDRGCDEALSRTGVQASGTGTGLPYKRGPKSEIAEAERHGACGQWLNLPAPRPGSTVAALDTASASRRSAAPHPTDAGRRAGSWCVNSPLTDKERGVLRGGPAISYADTVDPRSARGRIRHPCREPEPRRRAAGRHARVGTVRLFRSWSASSPYPPLRAGRACMPGRSGEETRTAFRQSCACLDDSAARSTPG